MKLILALLFAFLATWVYAEPLEAVQNTNDDKMNKALDEVLGEALNNDDDDDDSGDEDDVQNDDDDDGKVKLTVSWLVV